MTILRGLSISERQSGRVFTFIGIRERIIKDGIEYDPTEAIEKSLRYNCIMPPQTRYNGSAQFNELYSIILQDFPFLRAGNHLRAATREVLVKKDVKINRSGTLYSIRRKIILRIQ